MPTVRIADSGRSSRSPSTTQIAGSIARSPFIAGEPIRDPKLIKGNGSGFMAAILPTGMRAISTELSPETFSTVLSEVSRGGSTDVDLLIRTGGEQRLSDFLLWECAFAELVFLEKRWPDFTVGDLRAALEEFALRERTRGGLPSDMAAQNS